MIRSSPLSATQAQNPTRPGYVRVEKENKMYEVPARGAENLRKSKVAQALWRLRCDFAETMALLKMSKTSIENSVEALMTIVTDQLKGVLKINDEAIPQIIEKNT